MTGDGHHDRSSSDEESEQLHPASTMPTLHTPGWDWVWWWGWRTSSVGRSDEPDDKALGEAVAWVGSGEPACSCFAQDLHRNIV